MIAESINFMKRSKNVIDKSGNRRANWRQDYRQELGQR